MRGLTPLSVPRARGRPHRRDRAGYTLVEGLLTSLIAVIVMSVVYELHATSWDVMTTINANSILQIELSRAMDYLGRDAELAVATPTTYGAYTRPPSLIFTVPSVDATGHVIDISTTFDYIIYTYNADAGTLTRVVDASPGSSRINETPVIAHYVNGFTFIVGARDVTFTVSGSRTEHGRSFPASLSGQGRFRNVQS